MTPHLKAKYGIELVDIIQDAAYGIAMNDAHVNKNGDVEFLKTSVRDEVKECAALKQAVEGIFEMIWDDVQDQATHEKRVEWQKMKDEDKRLAV